MKPDTTLVHAGRHPRLFQGAVNPPVYRTSTVLAADLAEWDAKQAQAATENEPTLFYGRYGTPTTLSLLEAVAELEGGYRSYAYPSGIAACTTAILACVSAGDHMLVPDSVYGPIRRIAGTLLRRMQVMVEFYDPAIGAGIQAMMRPRTSIVYVEAPGSLTFEMQDIPAIAAVAHNHGAVVIMDNTWGTPLYFKPFAHGVDISVQAATKYIVGHSDALLGVATATRELYGRLKATTGDLGQIASPDDCYIGQRGLRTMHVRLERHWASGIAVAQWLKQQPEVVQVMHPALPDDPGHALWKRDFTGACGLFAFVLDEAVQDKRHQFVSALKLFGLGGSWGGYESLIMPVQPPRTATVWPYRGPCFRLHAGLEHVDDQIADLDRAFQAIRTA